ncbi:HAD family hydrolase [Hydrogenophaga sp. BPS33]|uniref:HAD family hydrolase n=1 Tax=Hydrogenophaga sp. BPS33 TaxID=2651974 RepID=UPI00131F694C|nr:HAD-IA family hydrolase [Hydrogenophaga sp. BPS33]QHE86772.1 HAD-IA family hydrolase [Hydrogenophaga sp. BPS33]
MNTSLATALDAGRVRAITIDLDDTLWPIWPIIARAETVLAAWLAEHAPATAAQWGDPTKLREVRNQMHLTRPDLAHDLGAMRRESIRLVLTQSGDDPALAEAAFDIFFAERQRVELFEDALPALEWLAARYPVVALSNGNADVQRMGLGVHFRAALSAQAFGVGKPDARIFLAAAQAAGAQANEVLHIGDDAQLDVVGALGAGMQVAWLNREGHAWEHAPLQPHTTVSDLLALCRQLD